MSKFSNAARDVVYTAIILAVGRALYDVGSKAVTRFRIKLAK